VQGFLFRPIARKAARQAKRLLFSYDFLSAGMGCMFVIGFALVIGEAFFVYSVI
jgi:hypothetical protein